MPSSLHRTLSISTARMIWAPTPNYFGIEILRHHLIMLLDKVKHLVDASVSSQFIIANLQMNRPFAAELYSQVLHFIRPSRRKQHCLAILTHSSDYASDLWFEPHVKHPIGFVHHQKGDVRHRYQSCIQEIVESTWTSDQHFWSSIQLGSLDVLRLSSEQAGCLYPSSLSELLELDISQFLNLLHDLTGKLTGRCKHKPNWCFGSSRW